MGLNQVYDEIYEELRENITISSDGTKVEFDPTPVVEAAYEREYSEIRGKLYGEALLELGKNTRHTARDLLEDLEGGTARKLRMSVTDGDTEFLEEDKEVHYSFDIYRGTFEALRQNDVSLGFASGMEEALDDADLTSDFFV